MILRKIKIRTRLLIVFATLLVITATSRSVITTSLSLIKNAEIASLHNISTINEIHNRNIAIDSCLYNLLNSKDKYIERQLKQTLIDNTEQLTEKMVEFLQAKNDNLLYSVGELQDWSNLMEVLHEIYIPLVNNIIFFLEHNRLEEARKAYSNNFVFLHNHTIFFINKATDENLAYSKIIAQRSIDQALWAEKFIWGMFAIYAVILLFMARAVINSISKPIRELELGAERVINGEFDIKIDTSESNDEIASLTNKLYKMITLLTQLNDLKMETLESRHAKERAELLTRAKSNFIAKMSHEIRTPMNAITGMAELSLREKLPATTREYIMTIKQAGANLLAIINDLLDFSKIETGRLEICPTDYLFSSMVNDVTSIVRVRLFETDKKLVVFFDSNIPNALFGDEHRIRQVLLNLLSNAINYTQEGFIALSVCMEPIDENNINLIFEVSDSGKGIKPDDIPIIFGEFIQVDMNKNRGIEGTGLGLSITKSLVEGMGGKISVHSEYGFGSTFTVVLPQTVRNADKLAYVVNRDETSVLICEFRKLLSDALVCTLDNLGVECTLVPTESELQDYILANTYSHIFVAASLFDTVREICRKHESNSVIVLMSDFGDNRADQRLKILYLPANCISVANILNDVAQNFNYLENASFNIRFSAPKARVLVVDDVNTNLNVAKGMLLLYDIRADVARSGPEAIAAVKSEKYDLVLMDHMMPEMDGVEATARIRALGELDPSYKKLPIVALTANAVAGTREMFLENDFDDFLSKPVEMAKFNEILEKWIPQKKQSRVRKKSKAKTAGEDRTGRLLSIEGVDINRGVSLSGGVVELYIQTLSIFLQDSREKAGKILECLVTDNIAHYIIALHALKGATANIGANELSAMAKNLEMAGKDGNLDYIRSHTDVMLSELERTMNSISNALQTDAEVHSNLPADIPLLNIELALLKTAIDDLNPGAIQAAVKAIQPFTHSEGVGPDLESLLIYTLVGDYDEALATIARLLEK